jgi:capsular polysaccharide biosynthesis protein
MEKTQNNRDFYSVDLVQIIKSLWKKAWIIAIVTVLSGILGFCVAAFGITPKYSSSVMLYVNNGSFSVGEILNVTNSELLGARSLVDTYIVMLDNRTTYNKVIEKAGVDYTFDELEDMVVAESVNGTEVMRITVTSTDPYEAADIANAIAVVLPTRISEIIAGSSMEVVDSGAVNLKKVAPSITGFTVVGMLVGAIICVLVLVVIDMRDDTIRGEEYILQNYDYPILAKIPDLVNTDSKSYGYYYQSHKHHTK